jgi:cytochrome c oxidase assembly protein subunit 15
LNLNGANSTIQEPAPLPRWLHCWAVVTVCFTLALLGLGAVVTTFRVGMADPIWPTYPWHLLLINWQEPSPGLIIEHTHRAAGYIVGAASIVLAVGLWVSRPWRTLGWLGILALLGVIAQGVLGGLRVRLNALFGTDLAALHGSFAQLVLALLVGLSVITSRNWATPVVSASPGESIRLRRLALLAAVLIYLQIMLGSLVRHNLFAALGQRGHLLIAFAVVIAITFLVKGIFQSPAATRGMATAATLLAAFVVLQLVLGAEAWIAKFGSGGPADMRPVTVHQAVIRTAHFLVGSGIFATSVVIALQAYRQTMPVAVLAPNSVGPVGETA